MIFLRNDLNVNLCSLLNQEDAENIRSFVGGLEILVNLLKSENIEVRTAVTCVSSLNSVLKVLTVDLILNDISLNVFIVYIY